MKRKEDVEIFVLWVVKWIYERKVIPAGDLELMLKLAGYRNRLVHFYHDAGADELFEICASHLGDVERIADSLRSWLVNNPQIMDEKL